MLLIENMHRASALDAPLDHIAIGERHDLFDFECVAVPRHAAISSFSAWTHTPLVRNCPQTPSFYRSAAKVTGSSFYFLKNRAALLEIALINYAMHFYAARVCRVD